MIPSSVPPLSSMQAFHSNFLSGEGRADLSGTGGREHWLPFTPYHASLVFYFPRLGLWYTRPSNDSMTNVTMTSDRKFND